MTNKPTDYEIIKALGCCWHENECIGDECPLFKPINDCASLMAMYALDLINRLRVENERLEGEVESLRTMEYAVDDYINECFEGAKTEAINEFVERLLDKYEVWTDSDEREFQYVVELVEELKKELIGD